MAAQACFESNLVANPEDRFSRDEAHMIIYSFDSTELQIPEDSGEILVNKAIDMWEQHGHHLTKSDSPGPVNRSPT